MDDFAFAAVVNFLSLTSYSFSPSMSLKIAFLLKNAYLTTVVTILMTKGNF